MEKLQINIRKHKKLFGVLGLVLIVCVECCVFPVGNLPLGGDMTIGLINLATAIGISKCIGEIETHIFQKASWLLIFVLNFGITILGMIARYFLEYGEVGVAVQNDSDRGPIAESVEVEGVRVYEVSNMR